MRRRVSRLLSLWTTALVVSFGTVALLATGCNLQQFTADSTADLLKNGSVALDRESDLDFARDALPGSLKTIETFLVSSPDNEHLLLLLARGFTSYAFAFLERDLEAAQLDGTQSQVDTLTRRTLLHYLRAREYGFRLLRRPTLQRAALDGDTQTVERELSDLTAEDVPGLFWSAYAWASAVNLSQNDPDMVGALPTLEKMMRRVIDLEPGYFYSGAELFLGVYYASRPVMFGGDPKQAKTFFDAAMAGHGEENLLIPYLYGRFYGTQTQDRALFNAMIKKVLHANVESHPDVRLNNEVARDRARFWLQHADEILAD